jgi:hypothetical protein
LFIRQIARTVNDAADFENFLVENIKDQLTPEYDDSDAIAQGRSYRRRFRKLDQLAASRAQFVDKADCAYRVIARNKIADFLDIVFG